jgi:hypothetical protein
MYHKTVKKLSVNRYIPKRLIPGEEIEAGLEGLYVAIPDRGYKGKPIKVEHFYQSARDNGEIVYKKIELLINSWGEAQLFLKFYDKFDRGDTYTLGYFKVAEKL